MELQICRHFSWTILQPFLTHFYEIHSSCRATSVGKFHRLTDGWRREWVSNVSDQHEIEAEAEKTFSDFAIQFGVQDDSKACGYKKLLQMIERML